MSHDQQTVLAAYDAAVQKLYATFLDQVIQAGNDTGQQQLAEQHFITGLADARRVRDVAIRLAA